MKRKTIEQFWKEEIPAFLQSVDKADSINDVKALKNRLRIKVEEQKLKDTSNRSRWEGMLEEVFEKIKE